MANKLADILSQESSGIIFPFRTNVKPVKTEQQVYTPTEGIMNVKGTAYEGPSAVITYGTEEQGYPRQLKEIEKGMLPQFDQSKFPEVGKGKIETTAPAVLPIDTATPIDDKPLMDPCPPGFKLDPIKKICVPIEKPKSEKKDIGPTNPPRNIGPLANSVSQVADAIQKQGGLYKDGQFKEVVTLEIDNSTILSKFGFLGKFIDDVFIKGPADKKFLETFGNRVGDDKDIFTPKYDGITVSKDKDGKVKAKFNQKGKETFDRLATEESLKGNLASTQKKDNQGNIIVAPNGQPMIVGPISATPFGTTSGANFGDQRPKSKKTFKGGTPKKGTGSSGPPGRSFTTSRQQSVKKDISTGQRIRGGI